MASTGRWADPGNDDPQIEDAVEFNAQQMQAYNNALALVPVNAVPMDLLDNIADTMLTSRNMALWQCAPSLLCSADYRGLGARLAAQLEEWQANDRWDALIDPVRSQIRSVR